MKPVSQNASIDAPADGFASNADVLRKAFQIVIQRLNWSIPKTDPVGEGFFAYWGCRAPGNGSETCH